MSSNDKKNTRSRRRGVRASRVKLTEALAAAGIKSQAALAERIADLEGLDAAPRDIVYRVFRQQPVDLSTLTRVARALEAPLHELLLSSEESSLQAPVHGGQPAHAQPGDASIQPRTWQWLIATVVALSAITAPIWYELVRDQRPDGARSTATEADSLPLLDLTGLRIVVRPFNVDGNGGLADALRKALVVHSRVATAGSLAASDPTATAEDVAERLDADIVVEGKVKSIGRHVGLRIFAWSDERRKKVWATNFTLQSLNSGRHDELASEIVLALRRGLSTTGEVGGLLSVSAQVAYLRGRFHLDQSRTELNVKRATTQFEAALRDEPDYAAAHAGLCMALVQESRINAETRLLRDAKRECARANKLAPDLAIVRQANANLARRSGQNEQSEQLLRSILAENAADVDALMGMAENALTRYRTTRDDEARAAAIAFGERANAIEPDFWKAPFTLARVQFLTGHVDAAIASGEAAVAADANEHSVANLGTSYLCRGNHKEALAHYLRAREISPNTSLGVGQMCVAYYFAREFDRAVAACKSAIDADSGGGSPALHETWGNLADAYRQAGDPVNAADAYARAAELAERTLLALGHSPNARAHLAYYYTALRSLAPKRVPEVIADKLEGELSDAFEAATDPQSFIRIASAWALLGRLNQARAAYAKGTADCAGFGATPDLDDVRL